MNNPKPINFRPNDKDEHLIDLLMDQNIVNTKSSLFRLALVNLCIQHFGEIEYQQKMYDYDLSQIKKINKNI